MNYELAKELKDAGFPQKGEWATIGVSGALIKHSGDLYIPTLSELIRACGNIRLEAERVPTGIDACWGAFKNSEMKIGDTPE